MKRLFWVMAVLAALLALPAARPASALSCLHPKERIPEMQTVVLAKIVAIPKPHFAEIEVERYYRGSGVAKLTVEFRGVGGDLGGGDKYMWALEPQKGFLGLLELQQDEAGIFVHPCALYAQYDPQQDFIKEVMPILGEGKAPDPGQAPAPAQPEQSGSNLTWILLAAGGAVVVAGGVIYLRKRST